MLSTDWLTIDVIFARYSLKFVYRNDQTKSNVFAQCLQVKRTICDCSRLIYFSSLHFVLSIVTQLLLRIGPISWPNMDMFWTDFFSPIGGKVSNSYHNCDRAGPCCVFGEESFQTLPLQLWPTLIYDFLFQMTKSHLLVFKCWFWALVYVLNESKCHLFLTVVLF